MMPEACFRVPGYAKKVFISYFGGLEPRREAFERFGGEGIQYRNFLSILENVQNEKTIVIVIFH